MGQSWDQSHAAGCCRFFHTVARAPAFNEDASLAASRNVVRVSTGVTKWFHQNQPSRNGRTWTKSLAKRFPNGSTDDLSPAKPWGITDGWWRPISVAQHIAFQSPRGGRGSNSTLQNLEKKLLQQLCLKQSKYLNLSAWFVNIRNDTSKWQYLKWSFPSRSMHYMQSSAKGLPDSPWHLLQSPFWDLDSAGQMLLPVLGAVKGCQRCSFHPQHVKCVHAHVGCCGEGPWIMFQPSSIDISILWT